MFVRGQARLADIQAQQVEVGRIRLGTSTPKTSRAGKSYNEPVKLERFRLTSRSRQLIELAAELYGGEPGEWTPQGSPSSQWEVIIERDWLGVIVPPSSCSQYYEQWANGRCQVRCDGQRELLTDTVCPCGPDPAQRRCKPYTRLSLMLAEMNGIGIWRLETHGYYAAAELPAVADLLSVAGGNVPARLEMEQRSAEVPDPRNAGKTVIANFMVPVLHVEATPAQIVSLFDPRPALASARHEAVGLPATPDLPALPAAPSWDGDFAGNEAGYPADDNPYQPAPELPGPTPKNTPSQDFAVSRTLRVAHGNNLVAATSLGQLDSVAAAIAADKHRMSESDLDALRTSHARRKEYLASAAPPAAPPPATPAPPPADAPDPQSEQRLRQETWLRVCTWAGFNNLTLSGLKERYAQRYEGQEINQADSARLIEFEGWLQS